MVALTALFWRWSELCPRIRPLCLADDMSTEEETTNTQDEIIHRVERRHLEYILGCVGLPDNLCEYGGYQQCNPGADDPDSKVSSSHTPLGGFLDCGLHEGLKLMGRFLAVLCFLFGSELLFVDPVAHACGYAHDVISPVLTCAEYSFNAFNYC